MTPVSDKTGVRMLRSAPAMSLGAIAAEIGTSSGALSVTAEKLRGRGRCDRMIAATMHGSGSKPKRMQFLRLEVVPPFAARRFTWNDPISAHRANGPGTASWAVREVGVAAAPRAAFTQQIKRMAHFSDRSSFLDDPRFSVAQPHCPPAITTWLATSGLVAAKRRLPDTSPPLTALAALVTDTDIDIDVATRVDLPPALAVANHRALLTP